jgi:hypothetical protein
LFCLYREPESGNTAERYCQDWQTRFGSQEVKVWAHGEEGDLVSSILKVTADDSFSLVVAEFDTKTVSRSEIRSLVKDVAGPVLIVRRSKELLPYSDDGIFSRVVFATDWSPVSEHATSFLSGFNALRWVRCVSLKQSFRKHAARFLPAG